MLVCWLFGGIVAIINDDIGDLPTAMSTTEFV